MLRATMTSKGRITIPKKIRDALRLRTGDRVIFRLREDSVVEMLPCSADLLSLFGVLKARRHVTMGQMSETIRRARG